VFFPTQPLVSELEWQFEYFMDGTGCSGVADELACLRFLDTGTLQRQNNPTAYPNATGSPAFYFTPTVDGNLIQDFPYRLFEDGKFIHVPIIFGDDTDEGTLIVTNAGSPQEVADFMFNQYPKLTQVDTDSINAQYPLMTRRPLHAAYFPSLAAAYGESTFTCPAIHILQTYSQYFDSNRIWSYRVNIQEIGNIDSGYGVPHTFELPAIFGPGYGGSSGTSFETYNAPMVPIIMNYWISFIRTLSPNQYRYDKAPYWEAYSDEQKRIVLETGATAMEDVPSDQLARCQFWKILAVTMEA
jgi:acetylcholinesterase